jgi:enterobacterial common antigen flippase
MLMMLVAAEPQPQKVDSQSPVQREDLVNNTYSQIIRSSSIIGGAQGINYLVGMVRTKLVAVLLGPSGIGLVGLYTSTTGMLSTVSALGIGSSGVREVAEAYGSGVDERVASTAIALRRACWITGLFGWILSVLLAYPLSYWAFESSGHAPAIAVLGATILLGALSSAQTAILQGTRRIGDLAKLNIISVLAGSVIAVGLYALLRERGIIPVLIATSAINLAFSWWFARRIKTAAVEQSWTETAQHIRRLVSLGVAFMWSGLLAAVVALAIRAVIVRELGLDANGIYQAAWGISGMFAGFVLGAMVADFYPRLTGVAHDHIQVNQLVNEQTEIGVLLTLPGLMATLSFAPWVIRLFYSEKFVSGETLLPWFVLGIFGQVVSWPLGIILIAKGAKGWYAFAESSASILKLLFSLILLYQIGLQGTAIAYPLLYSVYTAIVFFICRGLTDFSWTTATIRLLIISGTLIIIAFGATVFLPKALGVGAGAVLTALTSFYSLASILRRLGSEHRATRCISTIPGMSVLCPK